MPQGKRYYFWDAVDEALEAAEEQFHRKNMRHGEDKDEALSQCSSITLTAEVRPQYHQLVTVTFKHRVPWRSMICYFNLRQQADRSYKVWDVKRNVHL